MELLAICLVTGVAAGIIGSSKGRSGFGWFLIGFFFSIIGVLIAIGVSSLKPVQVAGAPPRVESTAGKKKCPSCAEWIMKDARKCRYCGDPV